MNKITASDLAKELNIKPRSVWYWIDALKIKGDRVGAMRMILLSDAEANQIREHCAKYQDSIGSSSVAVLMKELDLSKQGVWDIIKVTGLRKNARKGSNARFSPEEVALIRSVANERKENR